MSLLSEQTKTSNDYRELLQGCTNEVVQEILSTWEGDFTSNQCAFFERVLREAAEEKELVEDLVTHDCYQNEVLENMLQFYNKSGFLTRKQVNYAKSLVARSKE